MHPITQASKASAVSQGNTKCFPSRASKASAVSQGNTKCFPSRASKASAVCSKRLCLSSLGANALFVRARSALRSPSSLRSANASLATQGNAKHFSSYLNFSKKEINLRIEKLFKNLENCQICPRKCRINRLKDRKGFCKLGKLPMVSSYHSHFGEESVLVGSRGSGTIFFTSCNLSCIYCQNYEISQLKIGEEVSFERLAEIMIELQNRGCYNINLVTPTCQIPQIIKSLSIAIEGGLKLPLVYNTNAYDSVKTLKLLEGIVDIYMPDAKYSDNEIALKYSNTLHPVRCSLSNRAGYFEIMKAAIKEMHRQIGDLIINEEGIAIKGLLVRHLVLPNNLAGTKEIVEFLAKEISKNTFINIMDQYWPYWRAGEFSELSRRITKEEYFEAIKFAKKAGLKRL